MTELRKRQKALARAAILEALAELVAERRHLDFSVQEVADRAGVSLRTVYNHFPSREALLDGLSDHFNAMLEREGGLLIDDIDHVNGLTRGMATNYRLFSRFDALSEAFVEVGARSRRSTDHALRTARVLELVGEYVGDDIDDADVRLVGTVVRHLVSQLSWWALTHDYRLDDDETVLAARWALITLLRAAHSGELPSSLGATEGVDGTGRSGIRPRPRSEEDR